MSDDSDILKAFMAPFQAKEVKWKPAAITKDKQKAMAVCYIDARIVMNRLDDVVGAANWSDEYQVHTAGVVCRLSVRLAGEWVTKADGGSFESTSDDAGEKLKAACSDALKRAAVKWGIGRYLYTLPRVWCKYDAEKKTIVNPPNVKLVKGGAVVDVIPEAIDPGEWLKESLKGTGQAYVNELLSLLGLDAFGKMPIAVFPLVRDVIASGIAPKVWQARYLPGTNIAEVATAQLDQAVAKWHSDQGGNDVRS